MEKKVRYLMLLLCLFLFPFRVYALDEPIEDTELNTNESSTIVVKDTGYTNDNQMDQTDPEIVSKEDETEPAGEEEQPATPEVGNTTEPTTGTENPVVEGDNTQSSNRVLLGNPSSDTDTNTDDTEPTTENDTPKQDAEVTKVKQIHLNDVNTRLTIGEAFNFGATTPDTDEYTVDYEEWIAWENNTGRASADARNQELPNEGITVATEVGIPEYEYSVGITFKDGYDFEETESEPDSDGDSYTYADFTVNGYQVHGYLVYHEEGSKTYRFTLNIYVSPFSKDAEYIDQLELKDVTKDAYIGETPVYTTTTGTEHTRLESEYWYWIETSEEVALDENGQPILDKDGNPKMLTNYNINFDIEAFEGEKEYYHGFIVSIDDGYFLNYLPEAGYENQYKVTINGVETDCNVVPYYDEETGRMTYDITIKEEVTPVEAPVNNNTETPVATVTDYRYDSNDDGNGAVNLTLTTEKKDDSKLEVKKDDKEKEQEKEKAKENSNVGLIIFLIILVIIAIAIPVTIYKKKQ